MRHARREYGVGLHLVAQQRAVALCEKCPAAQRRAGFGLEASRYAVALGIPPRPAFVPVEHRVVPPLLRVYDLPPAPVDFGAVEEPVVGLDVDSLSAVVAEYLQVEHLAHGLDDLQLADAVARRIGECRDRPVSGLRREQGPQPAAVRERKQLPLFGAVEIDRVECRGRRRRKPARRRYHGKLDIPYPRFADISVVYGPVAGVWGVCRAALAAYGQLRLAGERVGRRE